MTISEKNRLKKNQYVHLATIATSLALCNISEVNSAEGYTSPKARFLSAEHCVYPIDYEIKKEFLAKAGSA